MDVDAVSASQPIKVSIHCIYHMNSHSLFIHSRHKQDAVRTIFMIGVSFLVCIGGNNNDDMYACMCLSCREGRESERYEDNNDDDKS